MKRILLSYCLLAFIALNAVFSQTKLNVDSLTAVLNKHPKEDIEKVRILITLSNVLTRINAKEGMAYSEDALRIAEKFNHLELKADALFVKAQHLKDQYKRTETLDIAKQALSIYESLQQISKIAETHNLIGRIYDNKGDFANGKKHFENAITLADQIGYKKVKIAALNGLGVIYIGVDDNVAVSYNEQAIQLAQKQRDLKGEALALGSVALCHYRLGNYPKATETVHRALKINESIKNDYDRAYNYRTLGHVYAKLSDFDKALDCYKKGLEIARKTANENIEGSLYYLIGNTLKAMKKYDEAISNIEKGNELNKKNGTYVSLWFLGSAYDAAGRELDAHRCYEEGLKTGKKSNKLADASNNLLSLGQLYLKVTDSLLIKIGISPNDRYTQAETVTTEALEIGKKMNAKQTISEALKILSDIYERNKAYTKAYTAYKEYISIRDSIKGDDVKKQITRKEIQYEFDKKEAALKYEQQLTANELEKQRLLTFQQGQTLTLKEQALALSNKEKDLVHLAFLKEKAEKQEKEQALLLAQKDKDLTGVQLLNLAKEKALQFQEIARKNATIGFLGASVLAILLAAALFYLWLKKRQAQTEATRQAELQAGFTQQLFAETESERARIARDLHDGISHELLGLKRTSLTSNGDAAQKIDGVIESIRQISRNLHPVMLDSIGLQLSIESFCEQFAEAHNLFVNYEIDYSNELHKNTELQVLRIIQEALTNTAKHAKAQAANVSLSNYDNGVLLKIQDNGKGFDVEKALNSGKAFGLQSIIERAKIINTKANIYSTPQGTIIELKIS